MTPDLPPARDRPAVFQELYEQHRRAVWAVGYARRLDANLALDIVQESFLRLWKAWDAGEVIHNPRAWLMRVARNLAEDDAKSAFRRNGTQPPEQLNGLLGGENDPPDLLMRQEKSVQVRAALRELPEADREVLTYRYALEYDAAQIAQLIGASVTAVHMRLSRARQRLAKRLNIEGIEE